VLLSLLLLLLLRARRLFMLLLVLLPLGCDTGVKVCCSLGVTLGSKSAAPWV
jgi:hypothetical protein